MFISILHFCVAVVLCKYFYRDKTTSITSNFLIPSDDTEIIRHATAFKIVRMLSSLFCFRLRVFDLVSFVMTRLSTRKLLMNTALLGFKKMQRRKPICRIHSSYEMVIIEKKFKQRFFLIRL